MNNDFDFIKDKFDNDGLSAPPSLNESVAMNIISDKKPEHIRFYKKKSFRAAVALVACAAVVISCISVARISSPKITDNDAENQNAELKYFNSYNDMEDMIEQIDSRNDFPEIAIDDAITFKDEATATESNSYGMGGEGNSTSYATTYTQVEGIDEGYIVKNDGEYIYVTSGVDNIVKIYKANGMKPELVAELKDDFIIYNNVYSYINEMYIKDNRLIVNYCSGKLIESSNYSYSEDFSHTVIYDVSDMSNIKKLNEFTQSGSFNSSRMIDDTMYLISVKCVNKYMLDEKDGYVPYTVNNGKREYISAESICCPDNPSENSLLVISAIDTKSGVKSSDSKAIFGCSGTIYCNKDNLYIAIGEYSDNIPKTDIIKVNIKNGISVVASGKINGSIHNQFSMDEYNGYLRVATTVEVYGDDQFSINRSNSLYVLDEKLSVVGELNGYGETERIQAVKFMGDTAYVITYIITDPLFVIDISNPAKPKILGKVEIEGYSSQLLTIGEDRVLGIGEAEESGIKLVLFDTSDKSNPKVLDTYIMAEATSNAQFNHKAITINKDKGYYAIDYDLFIYNEASSTDKQIFGAMTFRLENDKINVTNIFKYYESNINDFDTDTDNGYMIYPLSTTYVGDVLYVVDSSGGLHPFLCE